MILLMLLSTLITTGLCLALIPLARKVGLVDHPGERKAHVEPTPLTGGPALLITSGLMLLFLYQGNPFVQGLARLPQFLVLHGRGLCLPDLHQAKLVFATLPGPRFHLQ